MRIFVEIRPAVAAQMVFALLVLAFLPATTAYPPLHHQFRQRAINSSQVAAEYDYIVVGGGQSGLVVANRLSEGNATVLVVEYGYFDNRTSQIQPSSAVRYPASDMYNLTSVPQMGLEGSRQTVFSAAVVGGGSTINGMMLNRGAADDYDNWVKLDNPGWGFQDLLPYFIKSTMLQEPSPSLVKEYNITYNASVYGTDGPIHVSFAPFQWPGIKIQYQGLVDLGAVPQFDGGADGNAYGVFWFTSAIDNTTETRSYARSGYYDPIANRTNLQLLTGWRVNEVLFNSTRYATGITMEPRSGLVVSRNSSTSTSVRAGGSNATTAATNTTAPRPAVVVRARREIILAAGALHSPQILQRSGIGPAGLLQQAGIDVLVDLPGVGSNLQDHPVGHMQFNFNNDTFPNPTDAHDNDTFQAWAQAEWTRHRRGPNSWTVGNTAGLLPLPVLAPDVWLDLVNNYTAQHAADFLPVDYTPDQVRGYEVQRALLAASMRRPDNAVLEFPIQGTGSNPLLYTKPLSRGTILLDPFDRYGDPVVDYQTFVNPVDARIAAESVRFVRRFYATHTLAQLGPEEQAPGAQVASDAALLAAVRRTTGSTAAHLSGTNAMMPRAAGGVVDATLQVYGTTGGLSVADASMMPLIVGAHLCATVYAVAEKAADLIKARHGEA